MTALVALLACYWTAANYPAPAALLSDHGGGYQLAAGLEILAGRHPVIDFDEIYGPLTFYTSALGQWLSGKRVIGEIAIILAAFACGYALLFRLMLSLGVSTGLALGLTAAAILAQPAGFRYYLLLCPLTVLAAGGRFLDAPSEGRRALLALAVTVGGLFRPDLGAYGFIAAVVLVATGAEVGRWREAGRLTAFVVAWAAPWLLWLIWQGKLGTYLELSAFGATEEAIGRAKPPPWPDFSVSPLHETNVKAYLFRLPWLMLAVAAVMLVVRRKEIRGTLRPRLLAAFVLAVLTTLQALHIVDWIHVRDTFHVRFLLLAWVAAGAWTATAPVAKGGARRFLPLTAVVVLTGSAVVGALVRETERTGTPAALAAKLREHGRSRAELLTGVRESGKSFRAELYEYVRDHSAPDETIVALLECPQMNYFADRRFASRQMAIFPGYFSSERHQRRLMAELRTGPTAFVVIDHLDMRDYPEGAMARFAPEFLAFLKAEFVEVRKFGYCRVLMPRWRPGAPLNAPNWWEPPTRVLPRGVAAPP